MSEIQTDLELDCRGMLCPIPILKTKKAIDTLQSGQTLKMISTDPGSVNDIDAWVRRTGNELLKSEQEAGEYVFYINKS